MRYPFMEEPERFWNVHLMAADSMRYEHGVEKALGYLLGEKLPAFLAAADEFPKYEEQVPAFAAAIRRAFSRDDILACLESLRLGEPLFGSGDDDEDLIERMRELLL